ncbi:MAG: AAA family ATPase [Bacteroidia bacterium]|nr:AAA family ATPase [Bacteroidia bacterium]
MVNRERAEQVRRRIKSFLKFTPTKGQENFISRFAEFAAEDEPGIFLLKGYAGTGKTTMLSALTASFRNIVLLAPTGRAAKVLSSYTARPAFTIHKHLYRPAITSDGRMMLRLADNVFEKTLFIVDEASMIPDAALEDASSPFPGVNLLHDLLRYVYSKAGCRLMLVGDDAQLPPVHFDQSPALDPGHLQYKYRKKVFLTELTEVLRQQELSEILVNATHIRELIVLEKEEGALALLAQGEVEQVNPRDLPELLHQLYKDKGKENVMVITRSNRMAIQYNRMIRFQTLWMEDEISGGDSIMVVKNNYKWLPDDHPAGFIANGDSLEVLKVFHFEEKFGFRFAMADLRLPDFPKQPSFEAMILLDTLHAESPSLDQAGQSRLFESLHEHYAADEPDRKRRNALIRLDPYYNALQVKFAYAVTCHKAQGGQWPVVFVDQGYLGEESPGKEFYRWLYTAFTRASEKLYLLNFDPKFLK